MKKHLLIFVVIVFGILCPENIHAEQCEVVAFYRAKNVPYGTKALNEYDDLIEIQTLLILDEKIKVGSYRVSISRTSNDLYKVDGTDLYLETSLCLEFAIYDDVILKVIDYKGYTLGTITFIE